MTSYSGRWGESMIDPVIIGDATLYCGDCLEIMPTLGKVDAVVTDPPYGIALQNHARARERSDRDWTMVGDESQNIGETVLASIHAAGWPCVAFASPNMPWSGKWRQRLVWEKGDHVSGGGDPFLCWKLSWEMIQVARTRRLNGPREGAVLRFPACQTDYELHPSPKPVSLMAYLIQKITLIGDLVFDPFMGSGTTGVACANLGRKFIGIEIEPKYFDIACERIRVAYMQPRLFDEPKVPPTQEVLL